MVDIVDRRGTRVARVEIAEVQDLLDQLDAGERISIQPTSSDDRRAFLGLALGAVPQVQLIDGRSMFARLDPAADVSTSVLGELERRLGMWADLVDQADPGNTTPQQVRALDIYGGQNGMWVDRRRTKGVGGRPSVTVSVMHTGRHYADDVSDTALLYHYPRTARTGGRDAAEIAATRAACELRLPVFVILQHGAVREVRKAWVLTWDDTNRVCLLEFGPTLPRVRSSSEVETDDGPLELFEDVRRDLRLVRGRPNQQRFKIHVVRRYGAQCAICPVTAFELIHAAHLVPDARGGTGDPRNGLPLCANHHLALDRGLISIHPESTAIVVAEGHSSTSLNITHMDLLHLARKPATEALEYLWDEQGPSD
ncbi:HNH endonuclease [Conexibacter sp. CPCC 206217]|uniref:HNH endonuclease n=1 Tax=Conexibacter sp. CPCC 206217 TaxID=3064574 RepID=UPI00272581B9|nr:HNH endonuclease [Conexibacter sp. CPCC 206217]MDO8213371.1 HNH endonuclease [Conexibacter sp. CPCC 206217]